MSALAIHPSNIKWVALGGFLVGLNSVAVNWLGRSITHIGDIHSLVFGVVVGLVSVYALLKFDEIRRPLNWTGFRDSIATGVLIAYTGSKIAEDFNFTRPSITIHGALFLAVTSLVLYTLELLLMEAARIEYKRGNLI